jgi:hypothetical protein
MSAIHGESMGYIWECWGQVTSRTTQYCMPFWARNYARPSMVRSCDLGLSDAQTCAVVMPGAYSSRLSINRAFVSQSRSRSNSTKVKLTRRDSI